MTLTELRENTEGWASKGHPLKIQIFGWYLHTFRQKETFSQADVRGCYETLHEPGPPSYSAYFKSLVDQKLLLFNKSGYRLSGQARDRQALVYAPAGHKVAVTALLTSLPEKLPNLEERTYLDEALICYRNGAFRATVVMAWNLAYHHLCTFVLNHHLAVFNSRWLVSFPGHHKQGSKSIASIDDFNAELKESQVIAICKDANIITKDVWKILEEKLGKRNSAAHPSTVVISQLQTDAFVDDLVRNVVLKLV